jgi:hypothetical protein
MAAMLGIGGISTPAHAIVSFDATVTNNAIFGSGNANGAFTVDRSNDVELGLRGKLRFDGTNQPQNTFNSNGDGTYSFAAGQPAGGGFGFSPGSSSTAIWNFEWSINSDFAGSAGRYLSGLNYELGIDFDPGAGTNFLTFDPINQPNGDHSIGTNATGAGDGAEATDAANYVALIDNNNLAQNSWNMEFFDGGPFLFNANADGTYDFYLSASDESGQLARVDIQLIVGAGASSSSEVTEPGIVGLFVAGVAGLCFTRRRRRT